ncbi:hypothetical protein J6590_055349, partial [Homalodisca vitripennis]
EVTMLSMQGDLNTGTTEHWQYEDQTIIYGFGMGETWKQRLPFGAAVLVLGYMSLGKRHCAIEMGRTLCAIERPRT